MKADFQAIATLLDYYFHYGREDFANLQDVPIEDDPKPYLFVDPIDETPVYGNSGGLIRTEYNGRFLLLLRSKFDIPYDDFTDNEGNAASGKYTIYIEPLKARVKGELYQALTCPPYDYEISWTIKEVINMFNTNFDGVYVSFKSVKHGV